MESLKKYGKQYSLLVIVPVNKLQVEIINTMNHLKDLPGIYITLNKPASTMKRYMKTADLKDDKIQFIDCITTKGEEKNVYFVESPSALTTISIEISNLNEKINGDKFLIIDSLSTFLIYNDVNTLTAFVKCLIEKNKHQMIVFTPKEKDSTLIEKVGPFFDKIIEL